MDSARQIIRFSIPGSILILVALFDYVFFRVALGGTIGDVQSLQKLTTGIGLIAASVPFGFIVYQFYYWRYGPIKQWRFWPLKGSFVTYDRGGQIINRLPVEFRQRLRPLYGTRLDTRQQHRHTDRCPWRVLKFIELDTQLMSERYSTTDGVMGPEELPEGVEYLREQDPRVLRRIYEDNWYENWAVFRSIMHLAAERGGAEEVRRDYTTLSDIYHSLGASRAAALTAPCLTVPYVAYAWWPIVREQLFTSVVAVGAIAALSFVLAYVFHIARSNTWRSAEESAVYGLTAAYKTHSDFRACLPPPRTVFEARITLRRIAS